MNKQSYKKLKNRLIFSFVLLVLFAQLTFTFAVMNIGQNNSINLIVVEILLSTAVITAVGHIFVSKVLRPIEESNMRMEEFTSSAAHELKTPLTVIKSDIDLAMKTGKYDDYLGRALTEINATNLMITKLLQLSSVENEPEFMSLGFDEYINDVLETYEPKITEKNLNVKKLIHDNRLFGDESLILSLLNNLIENAIKFSVDSSTITIEKDSKSLCISNMTNLQNYSDGLVKRFKKGDHGFEGHGIGLSLVKRICEVHKWKFSIRHENSYFKAIVEF